MLWLFLEAFVAGLLAVFTPFVYTILPLTVGYLSRGTKSKAEKTRNTLYYALSIVLIFTSLGAILALIIKVTGLLRYANHWIFNLAFCRLFFMLGISLLGAFSVKLPASWIHSTASRAKSSNFIGIFYMALTLPGSSFASTAPIIVLVMVLATGLGFAGPIVGMFGFAVGLALPFVFPAIRHFFFGYKTVLNNVKVVLAFCFMLIGLKFLSIADASLGWHIMDREIFIAILILICITMGVYMLNGLKLAHDYASEKNIHGQDYVSLSHLFIAIAVLTFAVYLLPGMWGAPLHGMGGFLPTARID